MASESVIRRVGAGAAVTLTVLAVGGPSAGAITPPQIDPSVTPPTGNTGPTQAMAQRGECVTSGLIAGTAPANACSCARVTGCPTSNVPCSIILSAHLTFASAAPIDSKAFRNSPPDGAITAKTVPIPIGVG